MRRACWIPFLFGPLMLAAIGLLATAQDANQPDRTGEGERSTSAGVSAKTGESESPGERAANRPGGGPISITPARETAAITFARLHHPELADLLERLKKRNNRQYELAIRDLFLASERLARFRERAPEAYDIHLELWKVDSRLRLLAARMSMSEDKNVEAELKALLEQRVDLRLRQLRLERERVAERLQKYDEQIRELEQDPAGAAERDLARLQNSLHAPRRPRQGNSAGKGPSVPVRAPAPERE